MCKCPINQIPKSKCNKTGNYKSGKISSSVRLARFQKRTTWNFKIVKYPDLSLFSFAAITEGDIRNTIGMTTDDWDD